MCEREERDEREKRREKGNEVDSLTHLGTAYSQLVRNPNRRSQKIFPRRQRHRAS